MTNDGDLSGMRIDYGGVPFDVADVAQHWWMQFDRWLADAVAESVTEPNAMVLATVSADGSPDSRNVLAKQVDQSGVTFYTNYDSAKSADLTANRGHRPPSAGYRCTVRYMSAGQFKRWLHIRRSGRAST